MENLLMLTNQLPFLMAAASLIASLVVASLIKALIQFTQKPFNVMAIAVMLALTAGMVMMKSMS